MDKWDALEQKLRERYPHMDIRRNEPMSKHTTFRVGGPAALMVLPNDPKDQISFGLESVMAFASEFGVSPFFLGNGSNLLVSDNGYDGLVVKTAGNDWIDPIENEFFAGSGALLSRLAHAAAERGLTGLEFAAGIPGTVGGAITMNAGAYGGEIAQSLRKVLTINQEGRSLWTRNNGCGFSYRHSAFSDGKRLILCAHFRLTPGDPAEIKAKMADLAEQRKAKQPLEYPSAGSTFKRPAPLPDGTPVYAAALIDRCGCKGLTIGGAQVSEKHAGFIINKGGATCADILAVIEEVKKRVLDQTGVALELEVKTLGV